MESQKIIKGFYLLFIVLFISQAIAGEESFRATVTDSQCRAPEGHSFDVNRIPDSDCALSINAISHLPNPVLIDTRSRSDFDRYFVRDALHMEIRDIESQAWLKPRNVLLVNAGFRRSEMHGLCEQLKSKGFSSVRFLDGGINVLETTGYPLVYTADYVFQAPELSIDDYVAEITSGRVITLTLGKQYQEFFVANKLAAESLQVDSHNWPVIKKTMAGQLAQKERDIPVVLAGGSETIAVLEQQFRMDPVPNLYFLSDPDIKLQKYVLNNYLMNLAKIREIQTSKCGS